MLSVKSPTQEEMQTVNDTIHRYSQANAKSIERMNKEIDRQIKKDRALVEECEQVANEVYKQIVAALPDEHSKDLFAHYSVLVSGKHTLSHQIYTHTKRAYDVYAWTVKRVKKLLGK